MSRTIGFFGATGSYDFGDYAMLIHNIQTLSSVNPDYNFVVFTMSADTTKINLLESLQDRKLMKRIKIVDDNLICHVKILSRFFRFRKFQMNRIYSQILNGRESTINYEFMNALASLDLVIFNGGGYLQHSWHYHNIKFMIEILLAKKLHKPVIFLANSVGPMMNYDRYTRETLPLIDAIMVRDGRFYTYKLLENYGMSQMVCGADDLFFAADSYTEEYADKAHDDYVMIEIMAWINHAKRGKDFVVRSLLEFSDWLIENENKNIMLINFYIHDRTAKWAINKIISESKHRDRIKFCTEIHNMYEVFELYRNCSWSLSFKYHPVILALGNSKPCAGIITDSDGYYEHKLNGAFMNCEMDPSRHVIHIDEMTTSKLIEIYTHTKDITCSPEVRKRLLSGREDYMRKLISYLE